MTVDAGLRMMAGLFVAASVVLAVFVSPYFLAFTLFVAVNLFQSAFTGWCPMMSILGRCGLRR